MTPLEAEIRQIIASEGPLSVARYMALCLGHPTKGYYATRDPFGVGGDFVTAPEISQMFGELIGVWAAAMWQLMDRPAAVNLVELGPGRGTLMADALRAAKVMPSFRAAIAVHLVETSLRLRDIQRATLTPSELPLAWHTDIGDVPRGPAIVLANEFFDALPVHQAVKSTDGWHERVVGLDAEDRLAFGLARDPMPDFAAHLPPPIRDAAPGAIYEWRSTETTAALCHLVRERGAALIIDYGHAASGVGDTLQAVRRHGFADPLAAPGEGDLTAHVDFAALAHTATSLGARPFGPLPQGEFLHRLGLRERAARLKADADARQAQGVDLAVERLTGTGPSGMGELFKAMAIAAPSVGPVPPFTP